MFAVLNSGLGEASSLSFGPFAVTQLPVKHGYWTYGSWNDSEEIRGIVATSDGGYVLAGTIDASPNEKEHDLWLFEVNEFGAVQWNKTFGGVGHQECDSLIATSDGGYVIVGNLLSDINWGYHRIFLVKFNATGDMIWNQTFGVGNSNYYAHSLIESTDGGIAVVGYASAGNGAAILIKYSSSGSFMWDRTYLSNRLSEGFDVINTSDGGYAITGIIDQNETYLTEIYDMLLVKVDSTGALQWNKMIGGTRRDAGYSLVQNSDDGYVIYGYSQSYSSFGHQLPWLVKTDRYGVVEWNHTIDVGSIYCEPSTFSETSDGGYVLSGSLGFNFFESRFLNVTAFLAKVNSTGGIEWNRTYLPTQWELGYTMTKAPLGYAIGGIIRYYEHNPDALFIVTDDQGYLNVNYTLSMNTIGQGTVSPSNQTYPEGSQVDIEATNDNGWSFSGWNGDASGTASTTVTMYSNKTVTATFTQDIYGLTMHSVGQGTVNPGNQTYLSGSIVNLIAVPAKGWSFCGWSGAASGISNTSITMDSAKDVTATFTQDTYSLTMHTAGQGNVSPGNQTYFSGTDVNLIAYPSKGWSFDRWTGDASGSSNCSITMDKDMVISATFTQDVYSLTTRTIGQGTVSPINQTYISGTVVNLSAMSTQGWSFSGWSGDATGATNITITMDGNRAVTATFTQDTYQLTIYTIGQGIVLPGNRSYLSGTTVNLTVVPEKGWSFAGWNGGITQPGNTSLIINNNISITATFTHDKHSLTFKASPLLQVMGWGITINSAKYTATGDSLIIEVPSGNYSYSVDTSAGYRMVTDQISVYSNQTITINIIGTYPPQIANTDVNQTNTSQTDEPTPTPTMTVVPTPAISNQPTQSPEGTVDTPTVLTIFILVIGGISLTVVVMKFNKR